MKNLFRVLTIKLTIAVLIGSLLQISADAAGVVDRAFGTNGTVTTGVSVGAYAIVALFLPDGKFIVVGGSSYDSGISLVRYNENGSLDSSFGDNGKVIFNVTARIFAAALQSDGKILVVGTSPSLDGSSPYDFFVIRFDAQGTVDAGFGSGGIVRINQGSYDSFNSVAVQPDGKIVAAGNTSDGGNRGAVIRLNPNGSIDTTFAGGLFFYSFPNAAQYNGFHEIKILPNGRILLGASVTRSSAPGVVPSTGYFLLMLDSQGNSAADFGSQGAASGGRLTPYPYYSTTNFEILPNGKIFVADASGIRILNQNGSLYKNLPFEGVKTSLFSDGRVLVSGNLQFSSGNVSQLKLYSGENIIGEAKNVINGTAFAHPNGKIIVASSDFSGNFIVQRLNLITSQGTRIADYNRDDKTDFAVYFQGAANMAARFLDSGGNQYNLFLEGSKIIPELSESRTPEGIIRRDLIVHWKRGIASFPASSNYYETVPSWNYTFSQPWGVEEDIPTGGDFNGDAMTDLTVFRPSNGFWYSLRGENNSSGAAQWGTTGDKPVPADYDYDGKTDYAVYRPSTGVWWIRRSSDGEFFGVQFGAAEDIPLTGDFDGDGRADFVVFRPSTGVWYQLLTTAGFRAMQFGFGTDIPVPGDYDGDGRHDLAVFRHGVWYLLQSTEGFKAVQWGTNGDVPVSVRYDQ